MQEISLVEEVSELLLNCNVATGHNAVVKDYSFFKYLQYFMQESNNSEFVIKKVRETFYVVASKESICDESEFIKILIIFNNLCNWSEKLDFNLTVK